MVRAVDLGELDRNLEINLLATDGSLALVASLVRKRWPCLVRAHWIWSEGSECWGGWRHGNATENDSCALPRPPILGLA